MIVLGDLSGIQTYLFDVAEAGGGQARRLRARSFFIQLLAEAAAIHVLRALGWPMNPDHFVLSGAGKFWLRGPSTPQIVGTLEAVRDEMTACLLRETRGELRLSLSWAEDLGSEVVAYFAAAASLERQKLRSWAPVDGQGWCSSRLTLEPLDRPCDLCGHASAAETEMDSDTGEQRRVCGRCAADRKMGTLLPDARWLTIRERRNEAEHEAFGLGFELSSDAPLAVDPDMVALANLTQPDACPPWCPSDRFLARRLVAYIPSRKGKPVWFVDLAARAGGDQLLGVLKGDVDWLGRAFHQLLNSSKNLAELASFSDELDEFFSGRLKRELEAGSDTRWQWIYTVFSGGDDLLLIGPWDVMLDFAGRVRQLFHERFGPRGLTLSAGLALVKPKRPVKHAVAEATRLLEEAKTVGGIGADSKNRFAAFGQVWKWEYHPLILERAKRLANWVDQGQAQRSWLHTLLQLAEARRGDPERSVKPDLQATSRLAYQVSRNYKPGSEIRQWGEGLVERFDSLDDPEVGYLPAILRYALTATRASHEEG